MPRLTWSLFVSLFVALLSDGAVQAQLSCIDPLFQAGEVRSGVPLSHRFTFVNRGPDVIEVVNIRPSCGCLKPKMEQRRCRPGEEGSLLLEVNTLTQPEGPHSWSVKIEYLGGGELRELTFYLCARVRTEVTVRPAALVIYTDATAHHEIQLIDRRPQPLKITRIQALSAPIAAHCDKPRQDAAGQRVLPIRLEILQGCPDGRHEDVLHIYTSDPDYRDLHVPLTIVKHSRQQVRATPTEVSMLGAAGSPLPARIVLLDNPDDQEVVIERIAADHPAIQCQYAQGPGHRATLKVRIDHKRLSRDGLQSSIHVHLSKPTPTTLTIPVTCMPR